ncbi:uncharacterized protein TrAtP1_004476 [Trichoderma atroviride]|uniref:uncharacterized protein n=1 Tax=Hypocrea atroviridis TaxID=63577 RepID=UPI00331B9EF2|nr:hypothetical protein TrAtP1_004476 [Trichoderma atroviride]
MDYGITGNTATSGAKQNNTWVQFTLYKQNINTTTNVAASTTAAIGASLCSSSTSSRFDLWSRAYELVQQREGELMEEYLKYLDTVLKNVSPSTDKDLLNPEYIKCIVNQLFDSREKDGIYVQFPSGNTAAREEIEKLAKFLLWSDSIIKTTVNTEPHAALAYSGVSLFFFALAKSPVYNKAMLEGFNTLSNMQIFWKACEETYLISSGSQMNHALKDSLEELYSFMIEYQARIICHITILPVSRILKWVAGSDDWTEMMRRIQNSEQSCLVYITEGEKAEIHRMGKAQLGAIQKQVTLQEELLQDIKNNKQDDIERKLLGDLSSVSGDYARYKNINPERVPGTCEWFLADDRFCEWRNSQTGALLWASAGPGCGKSVLSRCLIDEGHLTPDSMITIESSVIKASQKPSVVCYFFFKEGQMDGSHALCAILHQLFQHPSTSNLINHALPSHKSHAKSLTQRMEVLWKILVDCAESSPADIICVLDALDECGGDSAQQLLGMIKRCYSQHDQLLRPSNLKFLITSRPYDNLKGLFDTLQSVATYMHFDGDENEKSSQIGEEINLVIDAKVRNIAGLFSDEDRHRISKRLKHMENRTYLWLHLTFNLIEKKRGAFGRKTDIEKLLDELPSQVADAYDKILSKNQDEKKVKALLQIVLAATRPLTLDEANNALALALEEGNFPAYATLQEKLWPQDGFETIVQNLCGLFIRIHDSKLSFIHQTAREFLVSRHQTGRKVLVSRERTGTWKNRLYLSESHGILSRACINYLQILDCDCENPMEEYPLFDYAARNWSLHFRLQDAASTDILRKPARQLCHISSPQARFWVNQCTVLSLEDPADLHVAAELGLAAVVHDVLVHEHANVNEGRGYYGDDVTPLYLALVEGHVDVVEVLLDPAHRAKVDKYDVIAAVRHDSNAEAMMTLLLDKRGRNIKITEGILESTVANRQCGRAVLALLLKRRGNKIRITESVVEEAAKRGSIETMSLLLDERGRNIKITEDILIFALKYNERELLALLLKREAEITEAVLIKGLNLDRLKHLDLILDHSDEIKITEEMVQAAARNYYGPQVLQLLLEKRGHDITVTKDILKAAADSHHGPEAIILLLDKYGHQFSITDDIVESAVARTYRAKEVLSLLLDKRGHEFSITDDIVKSAVARTYRAKEVLSLLLDKRGHEFQITNDIVKSAVANECLAKEVLSLLLNQRGHEFTITEDIVKSAVANEGDQWPSSDDNILEMVTLLLDKRGHEFIITEEIIKEAVQNRWNGVAIVTILLDRRGDEIKITKDIIKEARRFGNKEMQNQKGGEWTYERKKNKVGPGRQMDAMEILEALGQ